MIPLALSILIFMGGFEAGMVFAIKVCVYVCGLPGIIGVTYKYVLWGDRLCLVACDEGW